MSTPARRLHLDLSDVVHHARFNDTMTGIQRVQLEVARHLVADGIPVRVFSDAWGYRHDLTGVVQRSMASSTEALFLLLRRRYGRLVEYRAQLRDLRIRLGRAVGARAPERRPFRFGECDLIYVGGAYWVQEDAVAGYEIACRAGCSLVAMLHDLIPLRAPHLSDDEARPAIERMLRLPLHVIANSVYTMRELDSARAFAPGAAPFRSATVVPLAQEFSGVARGRPPGAPPSRRLARLASGGEFALTVGTVEKRKNQVGLAELWRKLRVEHGASVPKLVVAGRVGREGRPPFVGLVDATDENAVVFVERPTDRELAWLYGKCAFTAFPSFSEGWGLPVGESLWFGKACVASNATAIPEVGGELCLYGDPCDLESFAPAILRLSHDRQFRDELTARIRASALRTWSQVSYDLAKCLIAIAHEKN
jgi:glycosyltransferase involved in cell wall biosynthesis